MHEQILQTQNLSFRYDAGACMQFYFAIGYQKFMAQHRLIFSSTKKNHRYIYFSIRTVF